LLVLDKVRDPMLLNNDGQLLGLEVLSPGCNLLFTTRNHFDLPSVLEQAVRILDPDAASALLEGMRPAANASEKESVVSDVLREQLALVEDDDALLLSARTAATNSIMVSSSVVEFLELQW
jgi:hypothetical protein